jgi:hypothetical protein
MAESGIILDVIQKSKDKYHYAHKTIEIEHSEIHEGDAYIIGKSTTALAASSWIDIQLNCSNTSIPVHLKSFYINNSAGFSQVALYEMISSTSSTWVNSTTVLTPINLNRNSTKTSFVSAGYQPTLISSSCYLLLADTYVGSTGTNQANGNGQVQSDIEYVLKSGSTYVVRVTNLGGAGYCAVRLFYYEG